MHKVIGSSLVLGLLSVWSQVAWAADPAAAAAADAAAAGPRRRDA